MRVNPVALSPSSTAGTTNRIGPGRIRHGHPIDTKKMLAGKLSAGQQPAFHLIKATEDGDHPVTVACSRDILVVSTARDFKFVSIYALRGRNEAPIIRKRIDVNLSSPAACVFLSGSTHPYIGVSSLGIDTALRTYLLSSGTALPPLSFRHQRGINEISASADGRLIAVACKSADVRVYKGGLQGAGGKKAKGGTAPTKLDKAMVFNAAIGSTTNSTSGATGVVSLSLTQHPSEVPHGLCDRARPRS